jgi:hypothetical protein
MDLLDDSVGAIWTRTVDAIVQDFPQQVISCIIFEYLSCAKFEFSTDIPEKTIYHPSISAKEQKNSIVDLSQYIKVTKDTVEVLQYSDPWIYVFSKSTLCQQNTCFALIVNPGVHNNDIGEFRFGIAQLKSPNRFYYVRHCEREMSNSWIGAFWDSICIVEIDFKQSTLRYTFEKTGQYYQNRYLFEAGYFIGKNLCVGVGYHKQHIQIVPLMASCVPQTLVSAHRDFNSLSCNVRLFNIQHIGEYDCGQSHEIL